nr:myb-like protein l [Quercus suber]
MVSNWFDIAVSLGINRTPFQCLALYQRSLNTSILKGAWTKDEDAQLCAAVEVFGESNWLSVASTLEGQAGTQCFNRFFDYDIIYLMDSDQACKFYKWLDKNTCPRGRATSPLVHERFARYKAEAIAVRNERDEAHAREAEAWELLRLAKHKAEKTNLKLWIAEDKVYKEVLCIAMNVS